jgi:hypothetical protein
MRPCSHPNDLLRPLPAVALAVGIAAAWTCEACGGAVIRLNPPPSGKLHAPLRQLLLRRSLAASLTSRTAAYT